MIVVTKKTPVRERRARPHFKLNLPTTRPSILDPNLENEPRIDPCPCTDSLVLYLHNRPIAIIPGTSLEYVGLCTHLHRMRHRNPRKAQG